MWKSGPCVSGFNVCIYIYRLCAVVFFFLSLSFSLVRVFVVAMFGRLLHWLWTPVDGVWCIGCDRSSRIYLVDTYVKCVVQASSIRFGLEFLFTFFFCMLLPSNSTPKTPFFACESVDYAGRRCFAFFSRVRAICAWKNYINSFLRSSGLCWDAMRFFCGRQARACRAFFVEVFERLCNIIFVMLPAWMLLQSNMWYGDLLRYVCTYTNDITMCPG